MKNKINKELVTSVKISFTTKESWLKVRTKKKDLKYVLKVLPGIVKRLRKISPVKSLDEYADK